MQQRFHATHKRVLTVNITPRGQEHLEACDVVIHGIEAQMVADLSDADEDELRLLELCAARLRLPVEGET